ncbi:MAG: preprotein translocase subunit SecY [Planctomycetota bacterium]
MNFVAFQLFRIPETRRRILTTLGLLLAYRVGFQIPIPGMSPRFVREMGETAGSTAFGLLSAFSGAMLGQTVIFALGIMPYISASIIFSILAKVSPRIEALQKEGATGQKKINQYTRLAVVPISFLQALFIWFGVFTQDEQMIVGSPSFGLMVTVVLALMAGAVFVMWIGELITEYGVGNGASLIIMAGIIATMPSSLMQMYKQQPDNAYNTMMTLIGIWIAIVLVIVFIQKGERRVPIQYARLTRGRRVYGGQRHYLPLKVNMAGVMPIIFASALFIIPSLAFGALGLDTLTSIFSDTDGFVYITLSMALVFAFCFFWNNLMFRPEEIADNLREHGSFIPGIRPGAKTSEYLKTILTRITLAGASFLALIAVLPNFITGGIPGLQGNLAYFLGGTSVLIVVGVALDLVDRLNAQLVMRNYEGFMKKSSSTSGTWARRSEG